MGILEKRRAGIVIDNEEQVATFYDLRRQLDQYHRDMRDVITNPSFILPFLQEGRLFRIKVDTEPSVETPESLTQSLDFGWGIMINFQKRLPNVKGKSISEPVEAPSYIIDMLLYCAPGTEEKRLAPRPWPLDSLEAGDMVVVPCALSSVDAISTIKVFPPKNIRNKESRDSMSKILKEVTKRFGGGADSIPLLDPVADMGIHDDGFQKLVKVIRIESFII